MIQMQQESGNSAPGVQAVAERAKKRLLLGATWDEMEGSLGCLDLEMAGGTGTGTGTGLKLACALHTWGQAEWV